MEMTNRDCRCSQCGAKMVQTGMEGLTVIYHCRNCGNDDFVNMQVEENTEYLHKRSMLLGRVRKGVVHWDTTQWDMLRGEILDFTAAYQDARNDVYFQMAIIACLTKGFHDLDDRRYKECKSIFKITEKIYKRYTKNPAVVPKELGNSGVMEYEEYRQMYKKCKYDYQNTKMIYKLVFMVGKRFIPVPKL